MAYEKWFAAGDEQARRQLAILRLLGLFDRPASKGCLTALRTAPAIAGLSEALAGGSDREWNIALGRLADINLVGVNDDESVDCHPLIREYFAVQLKGKAPAAWQAGHRRLYEYLCASTKEGDAPTLEELQPLYQAVAHGCLAGLQQDAWEKVYSARIMRGNEYYGSKKLGALGSTLGAAACFFKQPWSELSVGISDGGEAWLQNDAAFCLRALGRLTEALAPMRAGLELFAKREDWTNAAISAGNLSELALTLGEVAAAERDAEQSVTYADRSGDAFHRILGHTTYADALHQAGCRAEAETRFREAEQMQQDDQPQYPLLYSLSGFRYCDLLLAAPERATWQLSLNSTSSIQHLELAQACTVVSQRAAQTLEWADAGNLSLLTRALDHLTLGRAALYAVILESGTGFPPVNPSTKHGQDVRATLETARRELDAAVTGLRRAGTQDHLPRGLLTRAWLRSLEGQRTGPGSAQEDLDEAWEIAERGPMPLFMVDIHLYRARLFGGVREEVRGGKYPWQSPAADLAAAAKLIRTCGYHRRDEELTDAKLAILGDTPA